MTYRQARILWAKRLLRAKYFVVMTDKESAIAFDGTDPDDFQDQLALRSQTAEIELFYEQLGDLVKRHQEAVSKAMGDSGATTIQTEKAHVPKAKDNTIKQSTR